MRKLLIWLIATVSVTLICYYSFDFVEVKHTGIVISHHITSNRSGEASYYTIVYSEGMYHEKHGLSYYMTPIGSTVTWTGNRIKLAEHE